MKGDVRGDPAEGTARHVVRGANNTPVHFGGSFHNPVYIVSFSEPDAPALLAHRYGEFTSRIDDVKRFVMALSRAIRLRRIDSREVYEVELLRVGYSRDTVIEPEPKAQERHRLMICQKDRADAGDHEWRVALTISGPHRDAPDCIWIGL